MFAETTCVDVRSVDCLPLSAFISINVSRGRYPPLLMLFSHAKAYWSMNLTAFKGSFEIIFKSILIFYFRTHSVFIGSRRSQSESAEVTDF